MASRRQMKLGLSVASAGYHYSAWRLPDVPARSGMDVGHHIAGAQLAERAAMDFIFMADWASIMNVTDLRIARDKEHAQVKLDPVMTSAAVAAVTSHVGICPTASTTYNQPAHFAARMATIDRISAGRAGWNMVTSTNIDEAMNFGLEGPIESDIRHARAAEFVDSVQALWPGGVVERDGPLLPVRGAIGAGGVQPRLPVITAGASANAQDLAARSAHICYGGQPSYEMAKRYYGSVKGRLAKYGRTEDDLLMMPGIMGFIGESQAEAEDKFARIQAVMNLEVGIGQLILNHFPDLTGYPLDEPVPALMMRTDNLGSARLAGREPEMTIALMNRAREEKLTLRQILDVAMCGFWSLGVIGTPKRIADMMEEWFEGGAADGFMIQPPYMPGAAVDFVETVIPELRRRGLFREAYTGATLWHHLGLEGRA